jgi:hypothetical protein
MSTGMNRDITTIRTGRICFNRFVIIEVRKARKPKKPDLRHLASSADRPIFNPKKSTLFAAFPGRGLPLIE